MFNGLEWILTAIIAPVTVYAIKKFIDFLVSLSSSSNETYKLVKKTNQKVSELSSQFLEFSEKLDTFETRITRLEVKMEPLWNILVSQSGNFCLFGCGEEEESKE
ncbi:MAG: hypothetical protein DRJ18_01510 [Candidatus Methanomethylicota archaeon]|nr:MAG: hypothetical protein DRJ18_01510 [Candidatus Verstraetearchaeota archaeon]